MSIEHNPLQAKSCFQCPFHVDTFSSPLTMNAFPSIPKLNGAFYSPILDYLYLPLEKCNQYFPYLVAEIDHKHIIPLTYMLAHETCHRRRAHFTKTALRAYSAAAWAHVWDIVNLRDDNSWRYLVSVNNSINSLIANIEFAEELCADFFTMQEIFQKQYPLLNSHQQLNLQKKWSDFEKFLKGGRKEKKEFGPEFVTYYEKMKEICSRHGYAPIKAIFHLTQDPVVDWTSHSDLFTYEVLYQPGHYKQVLFDGLDYVQSLPKTIGCKDSDEWIDFLGNHFHIDPHSDEKLANYLDLVFGMVSTWFANTGMDPNIVNWDKHPVEGRFKVNAVYPDAKASDDDIQKLQESISLLEREIQEQNASQEKELKKTKLQHEKFILSAYKAGKTTFLLKPREEWSRIHLPLKIEDQNIAVPYHYFLNNLTIKDQNLDETLDDSDAEALYLYEYRLHNVAVFLESCRQMVSHGNGLMCSFWPIYNYPVNVTELGIPLTLLPTAGDHCCGDAPFLMNLWESGKRAADKGIVRFTTWNPPPCCGGSQTLQKKI